MRTSSRRAPDNRVVRNATRAYTFGSAAEGVKQARQFIRLDKPVPLPFLEGLDAHGGVHAGMEAQQRGEIVQSPQEGQTAIGLIGRGPPNLGMEPSHIAPADRGEFAGSPLGQIEGNQAAVMALTSRLFPGQIPLVIELQQMRQRRARRDDGDGSGPDPCRPECRRSTGRAFARACSTVRTPYGPSVSRRTRPRIRFSSTKALICGVTRSAKPASVVSRTKTWPLEGKGVASTSRLVSLGMMTRFV